MRWIILAGLLVTTAQAADVKGTVLPPAEYDHTPTMHLEEQILNPKRVDEICSEMLDNSKIWLGCARLKDNKCTIYRVDDNRVQRHEYGHCNGWAADHPMTQKVKVTVPVVPWPVQKTEVPTWPDKVGGIIAGSKPRDLIAEAIRNTKP